MYTTQIKILRALVLLLLVGISTADISFAANSQKQSIFDIMHYKEVLPVSLESNFQFLKENRRTEEEQAATIRFKDEQGNVQEWNIKVALRGNYRRMKCAEMPPLKLNWKKSDLKEAGLAKFDDLKLVPFCVENKTQAYDLVLREYLAYKLFNNLTESSFRVQLLKINYIDSETGKKEKQWAFLIEDTAQLRDRLQAEKCENCYNLAADQFTSDIKLVSLFQYMIGNSDWSLSSTRNLKLLKKGEKVIPVPYDFDFSGMVNAPYAVGNANFKMTSIKQRIYLGFPENLESTTSITRYFEKKQYELLSIVEQFDLLSWESKTEIKNYLLDFFKNLDEIQIGERKMISATVYPPVETNQK